MPNTNQPLQNEPQPIRPFQPIPIKPKQIGKIIPISRVAVSTTLTGFQTLKTEKVKQLKEPEILDGKGLNSLAEDIREYETALGDKVWAATDKGVNYSKPVNEDRVGVSPKDNMVIVADGVGGLPQGDEAAQKAVESYLNNPDNPDEAVKTASQIMTHENINGSACFAAMKITEKDGRKYLNVSQAGDVKVIVVRNNEIVFQTKDHTTVQELIDAEEMTPDAALYSPQRNIVTNTISKDNHYPHVYEPFPLEKDDIVMGLTDGLVDNATPKEIVKWKRGAKNGREIIQVISGITDRRMKNAEDIAVISVSGLDINELNKLLSSSKPGTEEHEECLELLKKYKLHKELQEKRIASGSYSDGFQTEPKPDNRGIAVIEIN